MDLENETDLNYEEELQFSVDENKSPEGTLMGNSKKPNETSSRFDDDQYLQIDYLEEDENLTCSNLPSGIVGTNINPSQTKVSSKDVLYEEEKIINQGKSHFMRKYKLSRSSYSVPHNLKSKPLPRFCQPFRKKNNIIREFTIDRFPKSTVQNNMPIPFVTPISQRLNYQNSFHFLNIPRVEQFECGALSVLNKRFQQLQPFSSPRFDFSQNQEHFVRNLLGASDSNISVKYSSSCKNRLCPNSVSGNIDYNSNSRVTKSQGDTFRNRLPVNAKIDEKELASLKRVARLIRFGKENSFQRRKTESKTYYENLYFEDEYFQKMEEQKQKRQKIFELKEKQRHIYNPEDGDKLIKCSVGDDTILEKINPFYVKSRLTQILDPEIKQEVKCSDERETENHVLKGLQIIKCDFDSNVKFTRTISKTYEEMSLSRCSDRETTNTEETSIFIQAKKEIQSNGCIVKVLNLPQVTMSDVLALCSPVGKPLEVKLNVLKENAVIIKFANPVFAANFYGLYHGVKVNSHFLNIVII